MKFEMKDQFSVLVKVGNKTTMFSKSADSKDELVAMLKKQGLGVSNVVSFRTFKTLVEKQRGRASAKY